MWVSDGLIVRGSGVDSMADVVAWLIEEEDVSAVFQRLADDRAHPSRADVVAAFGQMFTKLAFSSGMKTRCGIACTARRWSFLSGASSTSRPARSGLRRNTAVSRAGQARQLSCVQACGRRRPAPPAAGHQLVVARQLADPAQQLDLVGELAMAVAGCFSAR